ncbi:hypothetical protein HD554DRAFT_2030706, partial [Boletus coccyginus]
DHPNRSTALTNLAIHLSTRYEQFEAMKDLGEAIVLDREAVGLCPQGHPDRSVPLNLAIGLSASSGKWRTSTRLLSSFEKHSSSARKDTDRPTSLNNLALRLSARSKQLGATVHGFCERQRCCFPVRRQCHH